MRIKYMFMMILYIRVIMFDYRFLDLMFGLRKMKVSSGYFVTLGTYITDR